MQRIISLYKYPLIQRLAAMNLLFIALKYHVFHSLFQLKIHMTQAINHWLLTAESLVRNQDVSCLIKVALETYWSRNTAVFSCQLSFH
jgi:hypothetical protein